MEIQREDSQLEICFLSTVVMSPSPHPCLSDQTACRLLLRVTQRLWPHVTPSESYLHPLLGLVNFSSFFTIQLKQPPGGTFPHSSVCSMAHCLYLHYSVYSIAYWTAYLLVLSPWNQGLRLLHPCTPRITYSAWHFRNTENNVWLCFNTGSIYNSELEKIIRILTKACYLVVL